MERLQILEKAFKDVMQSDFRRATSRDSFPLWDSLHHVILIKKLEFEFKIKFTAMEAISIRNTDELLNLVEKKCQS